jgi:uncharacterized protein YecE (DUF72 family)
VHVGVASWTDPTFTAKGVFYPDSAKTPAARLGHYSSRFPVVEADSPFYALPTRQTVAGWAERTPAHFVFDVKANALMTGHSADVSRLPVAFREALPARLASAERLAARDLPPELDDEIWRAFRDSMEPLHASGKLGAIFLQYAPWITPSRDSPAMLERARERLAPLPVAVEFRNAAWLSDRLRQRTWDLLERLGISYVAVDEPQGTETSVPPHVQITRKQLFILRLHGQRSDTWAARGIPVVEKYRYLYSLPELNAWVEKILAVTGRAERIHVIFNNCYANYGAVNAAEMIRALSERTG